MKSVNRFVNVDAVCSGKSTNQNISVTRKRCSSPKPTLAAKCLSKDLSLMSRIGNRLYKSTAPTAMGIQLAYTDHMAAKNTSAETVMRSGCRAKACETSMIARIAAIKTPTAGHTKLIRSGRITKFGLGFIASLRLNVLRRLAT